MKSNIEELHNRYLEDIAEEYKKKGYEVLLEPRKEKLPDFLKELNYHPDALAYKVGDSVIIEVKSAKQLRGRPELLDVAKTIESYHGWRFELRLFDPGELDIKGSPKILSNEEISNRLQKAEEMLEANQSDMAFLIAWTALEAKVRRFLKYEDIESEKLLMQGAIKTLYSLGFISSDDFDFLLKSQEFRNHTVHGLETRYLGKKQVRKLISLTRKLESKHEYDGNSKEMSS